MKFFLPAAGRYDNEYTDGTGLEDVSTYGHYWSLTPASDVLAYCLSFSASDNNTASDYKVDALTVRPFHALP